MHGYRIERFDTVVSTNELVKHALEMGYDEGLVCRAAEQVGGYGRQGRTWTSPRGGLYQSVLLRPRVLGEQLPTLSLVVALSVRSALVTCGSLMPDSVQVKWPNDVVCAQGKIAGISMEAQADGVCVGIGVNVWHSVEEQPVEGKNTPAYLIDIAHNGLEGRLRAQEVIDLVGDEVMDELWRRYAQWQSEGFAAFLGEFNACNALAGKHVVILDRNGREVASGSVEGVDAAGNLLVDGRPIASGEAHIR